ncbi:MAG: hypothetical protein EHM42_12285 [Planctomycetaceae bacterium]|nr:MAG: hypothetical protein EHM42_12285 [Planctomycetaceae bacterium]
MNSAVSAGSMMHSFRRNFSVWLPLVALVLLPAGCGQQTVKLQGNADESRQIVNEMLDAWKSGRKPDEFQQSRKPPVVVGDEDWSAGAQLKSFDVAAPVEYGGNWRVPVVVTTVTPAQGERQRNVAYGVTLKPVVTIIRADDTEF